MKVSTFFANLICCNKRNSRSEQKMIASNLVGDQVIVSIKKNELTLSHITKAVEEKLAAESPGVLGSADGKFVKAVQILQIGPYLVQAEDLNQPHAEINLYGEDSLFKPYLENLRVSYLIVDFVNAKGLFDGMLQN